MPLVRGSLQCIDESLLIVLVRAHLQLRTASSWEHALQALTALRTVRQRLKLFTGANVIRNIETYFLW